MRSKFWLGLVAACGVLVARPAGAADIELICRLRQTGAGSVTDFIRRLQIDETAKTVTIADDLGRGFQQLPLEGMLLRSDHSEIVFDYVDAISIGHSVIKWHTGRYRLRDGRFVTRGNCASALPDSGASPTMRSWPASPNPR